MQREVLTFGHPHVLRAGRELSRLAGVAAVRVDPIRCQLVVDYEQELTSAARLRGAAHPPALQHNVPCWIALWPYFARALRAFCA